MVSNEGETWTPDGETILWCFGSANRDTVMSTMMNDAISRLSDTEPWSDPFWLTISDMAIEATLFDLLHRAKEMGTVFPERGGETNTVDTNGQDRPQSS